MKLVDVIVVGWFFVVGEVTKVRSVDHLTEYYDTTYSHNPKITTSPMSTCDKTELRDICFWKNMTFEVKLGTSFHRIGTIGPPQNPDICNVKNISYEKENDLMDKVQELTFTLHPPDSRSKLWTFGLTNISTNNFKSKIQTNISCTISNSHQDETFHSTLQLNLIDCSAPQPQQTKKVFHFSGNKVRKSDSSLDNLIFLHNSSLDNSSFHLIINDSTVAHFLRPSCTYHADSRQGKRGTIIHCRLIVTKPRSFTDEITFALGLKNAQDCDGMNSTGFINVTFASGSKRMKRSSLFNNSKIFRTAAPYARITQPTSNPKATNYQCNVTNMKDSPFGITQEGILYVKNVKALGKSPEFISVNITWTKSNLTQFEEINVRIVEEPGKTCTSLHHEQEFTSCSSYKNQKSCLKKTSCGLGTGGSTSVETRNGPNRCMWRGDKSPENHETHLYSTCSSDTKYCPDSVCDSLEMLDVERICPQDCSQHVSFPTRLNSKTGRGVDKCNGVLICDEGCSCELRKIFYDTNPIDGGKEEQLVEEKSDNSPLCNTECILLSTGGLGVFVFIIFFTIIWRLIRMKSLTKDKYMDNLQEAETPFSDYIDRNAANDPMVLNFHMTTSLDGASNSLFKPMKVEPKWKFSRQQIFIEQVLGEGEFGKVLKAKAFNIAGRPGYSLVAVKTLKDDARKQDYNDLFSEYQLLKEVNHPHVIQLLGVCSSEDGPLLVIIEYAALGSLRNYLRRSRHILTAAELGHIEDNLSKKVKPRDILSFARQIASGMSYLSDIKLVHRDLAARNILLSDNKVCKISDFGLTRDIYEDNAYFKKSKGRVPVKWMAPESLADHVYTTKSDVWSYGILIWELITLGASPYPGIPVHNLYNLLKQGYRMERPPNCSAVLYSLMNRCWNIDPQNRPSFLDLYHCFDNLLTDNVNYLDLSDNSIVNRSYFSNFSIENESDTSAELLGDKINFLENNQHKKSMDDLKVHIGYETPVKTPRRVISVTTPSNEEPEEYSDMSSKQDIPSEM